MPSDKDGWLHTGDYVPLRGRIHRYRPLRDMIIRGGEKIYPRELRIIIHASVGYPTCRSSACRDDKYGEELLAFVN
jgi:fatty-acyl-CoA synthase